MPLTGSFISQRDKGIAGSGYLGFQLKGYLPRRSNPGGANLHDLQALSSLP